MKKTVVAYQSIICWEWETDNQHRAMVIVGLCAVLVPAAYAATCTWVVWNYPTRMAEGDASYLMKWNFMFFRYKVDKYWYVLVFLTRNTIIAVTPAIPDGVWQILLLQMVLTLSLIVVTFVQPWRVTLANLMEVVVNFGILCRLRFCRDRLEVVSTICSMAVLVGFMSIPVCLAYALYLKLRSRKPFQLFLCHHKEDAGALARLLKMFLHEDPYRKDVFVDSDDLSNLDTLFTMVAADTETLAVICTPKILTRPWCIGEICTARESKVRILPVYIGNFKPPDSVHIDQIVYGSANLECLLENGIALRLVADTLKWFGTIEYHLRAPGQLSRDDIHALVGCLAHLQKGEIAEHHELHNVHYKKHVEAPKTIVLADISRSETMASARILIKLLFPLVCGDIELLPHLFQDCISEEVSGATIIRESARLLLICSSGCFGLRGFLDPVLESARRWLPAVPVVCDAGFQFPSPEFYGLLLHNALAQQKTQEDADLLTDYVAHVFKHIATVFQPHGSIVLLQTQAKDALYRLQQCRKDGHTARTPHHTAEVQSYTTKREPLPTTLESGQGNGSADKTLAQDKAIHRQL
jgi:hypothetical protein